MARNRPLISSGILALYMFVLVVAQFGPLHRALHADADQPDHRCAVTLINSGLVEVAPGEVCATPVPLVLLSLVLPEAPLSLADPYLLLPGRGPPALLS